VASTAVGLHVGTGLHGGRAPRRRGTSTTAGGRQRGSIAGGAAAMGLAVSR